MYLSNTDSSLFTFKGQVMPKKNTAILSLTIMCVTLIVALALVRNDLCEVEYRNGTALFKAVLAYEVRD